MEVLFIASGTTLGFVLLDIFIIKQRKVSMYFLFFALMIFGTWMTRAHADVVDDYFKKIHEIYVFEDDSGTHLLNHEIDFLDVDFFEALMQQVPTRDELIMKMMVHRRNHDNALKASISIAKKYSLFSDDLHEIYNGTFAALCTCICGGRNFLNPALLILLNFVYERGWHNLKVWKEYQTELNKAQYNADMFDFYMRLLHKYYQQ